MELPKLPKHKTMFLNTIYKDLESTFEYYTAEQMQEYARQAVLMEREACAVLCEETVVGTRGPCGQQLRGHDYLAAEIRART